MDDDAYRPEEEWPSDDDDEVELGLGRHADPEGEGVTLKAVGGLSEADGEGMPSLGMASGRAEESESEGGSDAGSSSSSSDGSSGGDSQRDLRPWSHRFPDLYRQISAAIEWLGGSGVVPKLNWSCPTDATWVNPSTTLCCTNADQVD